MKRFRCHILIVLGPERVQKLFSHLENVWNRLRMPSLTLGYDMVDIEWQTKYLKFLKNHKITTFCTKNEIFWVTRIVKVLMFFGFYDLKRTNKSFNVSKNMFEHSPNPLWSIDDELKKFEKIHFSHFKSLLSKIHLSMHTVLVAKRHKNWENVYFLFFSKSVSHKLSKTVLDLPVRLF